MIPKVNPAYGCCDFFYCAWARMTLKLTWYNGRDILGRSVFIHRKGQVERTILCNPWFFKHTSQNISPREISHNHIGQKYLSKIMDYRTKNQKYGNTRGPFYEHVFTLIAAWISHQMPGELWNEIIYPFPNFNGCTVDVWKWISNFIPLFK